MTSASVTGSRAFTRFDPASLAFSRYGAYLAISREPDSCELSLRNCRYRFEDEAFRLSLAGAQAVDASPSCVTVNGPTGARARLYLLDDTTLAIDAAGFDLQIAMDPRRGYGVQCGERVFEMINAYHGTYAFINVLKGRPRLAGPAITADEQWTKTKITRDRQTILDVAAEEGTLRLLLSLEKFEKRITVSSIDPDRRIAAVQQEWERFLDRMPSVPPDHLAMAQQAWYTLWSCFVRARDVYKYDACLMAKKRMNSIWAWDHCFNALCLAHGHADLALGQFLLPFEMQAESGALPDMLNPGMEIAWGVTKPPVHGWCLGRLLELIDIDEPMCRKLYAHLAKWTDWWTGFRDSDGDGIPEYPQGCDSGWDNATVFDDGYFIESPDLSAYLILQMETLARLASRLHDKTAEVTWTSRAEKLLTNLTEHSWNGDLFVAKQSRTHRCNPHPTSLIVHMPLVLGDRLDKDKFDKLAALLERDFLTENGPATEALGSPLHAENSYWRGPIWAPVAYLLAEGLRRGGRADLARRIAHGFCAMVKDKAQGAYENFDPHTGAGLCAPGYTWTASVYLLLLWEFGDPQAAG